MHMVRGKNRNSEARMWLMGSLDFCRDLQTHIGEET